MRCYSPGSGSTWCSSNGRPDRSLVYLDDRLLVREPIPHFSDELDHMLVLHRSRLADVLHDAVRAEPRIDMRYGTTVTESAAVTSGKVTIASAAGSSELRADVVVGADGVSSRVREGGDFGARTRRLHSISLRLILPGRVWGEELREYWTRWGLCLAAPSTTSTPISRYPPPVVRSPSPWPPTTSTVSVRW